MWSNVVIRYTENLWRALNEGKPRLKVILSLTSGRSGSNGFLLSCPKSLQRQDSLLDECFQKPWVDHRRTSMFSCVKTTGWSYISRRHETTSESRYNTLRWLRSDGLVCFANYTEQSFIIKKSIVPPRRSPSNFGFEGPVTTVIWSIFNFTVS